jgi:hypothetical protein
MQQVRREQRRIGDVKHRERPRPEVEPSCEEREVIDVRTQTGVRNAKYKRTRSESLLRSSRNAGC